MSAFDQLVQERIQLGINFLNQYGWLDPATHGPNLAAILPCLKPMHVPQAVEIDILYNYAWVSAPACEYAGDWPAARAWYAAGVTQWRGDRAFTESRLQNLELGGRESLGLGLLPAAICADRVGDSERARELFGWAARAWWIPDEEVALYASARQYQTLWEYLPNAAFALAGIEDWPNALAVAQATQGFVQGDSSRPTANSQVQILAPIIALAEYHCQPNPATRAAALAALDFKAINNRVPYERLLTYFYLYHLRARFLPALRSPED